MAFNGHFNENGQYPIQRIEVNVDEIVSRELVGNHGFFSHKPVLFEVEANYCTPNTTTTTPTTTSTTTLTSTTTPYTTTTTTTTTTTV